ncbi:metalloprotease PmbA [Buchnera aphidicola]|uniref:metalloprotease PmbA n=1 Tax=Buchnera aphidicola TaxID=9 RepID=UPI00094CC202|nr:metalloprotease PmbA [Buchnera aphidicola]
MFSFFKVQNDLIVLNNYVKKALLYFNKSICSGMIEIKKTYSYLCSSRLGCIDSIECYNSVNHIVTTYNSYRQAVVCSSDSSIGGIYRSIDKSIDLSKYVQPDSCCGLPKKDLLFDNKKTINLFFPHQFSNNDIKNILDITNTAALHFDSRIINIENATFECFVSVTFLGNSSGWIGSYLSTYYYLSSCVIAGQDNLMERDYYYTVSRDFNDLECPSYVGQHSAKKSLSRLFSKKIATQISPVIFISDIASEFFGYLVNAANGYSIYKKYTFLLNYLNKKVFPAWFNIFENPFLEKGLSSRLFDDEGVSTMARNIIENGILTTWLLDTYTSNQLNMNNTGHAGGIYNWIVSSSQPTKSFENLLHTMNRGFLVTELLGDGVNIVTGDYSRGACGFWINQGRIQYPVSEVTISGNLIDMWNNIVAISDDINYKSNIQCASVLVDKIQISGC